MGRHWGVNKPGHELRDAVMLGGSRAIDDIIKKDWSNPRLRKEEKCLGYQNLSVVKGVIMDDNRPWIMVILQGEVLKILDMGHKGVN